MELFVYIAIQLVLWLFFVLFSFGEAAMASLNEKKLEELSGNSEKREKKLKKLNEKSTETTAALRLASMSAGFLAAGFAVYGFSSRFAKAFFGMFVKGEALESHVWANSAVWQAMHWISICIIVFALLVIISLVGYFIPRRLASQKAEKVAVSLYGIIFLTAAIFKPLVKIHRALAKFILKGSVSTDKKEDEVSTEDIVQLVDIGNKTGVIDTDEKEIIQNVFEFNTTEVMEFCTHRTDMTVLWAEDNNEEWEKTIHETRHTLYPICGESVDDVIGILNIKDYFALSDKSYDNVKANAIKPPFFVPQSMNADVLFKKMKQTRFHFAVVVDEYGGVFGIVTINDLLEQIVGELEEADGVSEEREIEKVDDTHWKVLGSISLSDLAEELEVKLPEDDYVNFNGYVLAAVGSIPDDGSEFEIDTDVLHIEVSEINANKIEKAIVSVIEQTEEEE
ncbi:MAG: HlyC/CorC family transporter [Clostridia bacterium]|nr:HlyC/CorC family transporter [Clostridia bacterium]